MSRPYPIPSFIGGVSTQPPAQMVPGQVTEANNVFLPIERGATKRNGTIPVHTGRTNKDLNVVESDEMFWHWIDRDGVRRYVVVICPDATLPDDTIQVFDITDGSRKTVNYLANGYSEDPLDYLAITGGRIKAMTVGDTTFLLNTAVTVDDAGTDTSYEYSGTSVDLSSNTHYKDDYTEFDQPPSASGEYWYAANDSVGRPAGYYVSQNHSGTGPKYARVHAREAGWRLKGDTLPVTMTYDSGSDEFNVECIPWADRISGDTETNPSPSFIGKTLQSFVFHQDRLWLSYEDRCIGSVTGDYYNFWLDNWRSVGDSDPIEVGTVGDRVTHIRHMLSFNASLVLFCTGDSQFEVKAGNDGQLTPSSVSITPSTQNSVDHDCVPAQMADRLYFLGRVAPTRMYEYFYSFDAYSNMAVDVSLHAQGYLGTDPLEIRTSDIHNLVVCLFGSETSAVYAHYSLMAAGEKVQSAWCKWTFGEDDIQSMFIFDSWLYLILKRGSAYYMDKMYLGDEPVDSGMPVASKIDRRFTVTGSYNSTTRITTWTLPFLDEDCSTVVLGPSFGAKAGYVRSVTVGTSGGVTVLTCTGDYSAGACWVGRSYEAKLSMPKPYVKDNNNRVVPGTMNILSFRIIHKNTGYYQVNVTPQRRETQSHVYNTIRVGSAIAGELTIPEHGEFYCKPFVSTENLDMSITSSSHLPMTVVSANYGVRFSQGTRNPAK